MNNKKAYLFAFFITFGFLAVILRIIQFQVIQKDELYQYIQKQYFSEENILLPRGTIFDSKGKFVAVSIPTITVFVIPKYIKDKDTVARELSRIIKIPEENIRDVLYHRKNYTILATNLDKSIKPQLLKLRSDLKEWNIGILENHKRFYPYNEIAGSTVGFTSKKTGIGLEGLEYLLNDKLGGGNVKLSFLKDATGNPITIENLNITKNNLNAVLTIDINLQYMAEEALKQLIEERNPKEAAVLIMNPYTGDIVAVATYPNYDPNNYEKYDNHKNIVFQNSYEIGSLTKPFILAEAIDEGKVDLNEIIDCQNGAIEIDGIRIKDHKKFGLLTPIQIIQHSSNVGTIKIALRLEPMKVYEKLKSLGFGKSTNTFPGETSGKLKVDLRPVNIAYTSIGQSWTASIIQVAVAYSAIANGGYRVKPRLVKGFTDDAGNYVEINNPKIEEKVLSDKSVKILKEILPLVVEEGTARSGKSSFFTIGGKTGTAQKYDPAIKALSHEKYYTWFAGFFPISNPKFVIVVFANEPKKVFEWEHIGGGSVSSTVMKDLIDRVMYYYKEKPDKPTYQNISLSAEQH